jgi:hypothetical protein
MLDDALELIDCVAGAELARMGMHCKGHFEIASFSHRHPLCPAKSEFNASSLKVNDFGPTRPSIARLMQRRRDHFFSRSFLKEKSLHDARGGQLSKQRVCFLLQ